MRHFSLCIAALFVFSCLLMAQHSSGGSSGGSSSSGGGGGSHGGGGSVSSGGSGGGGGHFGGGGSSGGGHSSAGGGHSSSGAGHSSGSGTVSHGSNVHAPTSGTSTHSVRGDIRTPVLRGPNEPRTSQARPTQPEKRTFFSFLRHPFRHPEHKEPAPDLRRRVCLTGPCQVCPNGQVASHGGCGGAVTYQRNYGVCTRAEIWNGGACIAQTRVLDDCSGYRMMMERQAQMLQAAESNRQIACAVGGQQCSEANMSYQSELNLYRSLQARYRQCRAHFGASYSFGGYGFYGNGPHLWSDPLMFNWSLSEQIW
jgi:hypothetical protein